MMAEPLLNCPLPKSSNQFCGASTAYNAACRCPRSRGTMADLVPLQPRFPSVSWVQKPNAPSATSTFRLCVLDWRLSKVPVKLPVALLFVAANAKPSSAVASTPTPKVPVSPQTPTGLLPNSRPAVLLRLVFTPNTPIPLGPLILLLEIPSTPNVMPLLEE